MKRALVTGATGFIGRHLVRRLLAQGTGVKCLVRSQARAADLLRLDVSVVHGDLADANSLAQAVKDVDVVYHLAGVTKSVNRGDLMDVNRDGTRNLAFACAQLDRPPVLVSVSSLAAAGPSVGLQPRVETDEVSPVSSYGRSKLAGEHAVIDFANEVPVTIVRPPIVIGEHDRDGFQWFKSIRHLGVHLTPGFEDYHYSMIHADDLAAALELAAERGERVTRGGQPDVGIYYAACDEVLSYAELGRLIGGCVGRSKTRVVRVPMLVIWGVALLGDLWGRLRSQPSILNLDKAREASAGAWACSSAKLRSHAGFVPSMALEERLRQTAEWYIAEGWL